jgi:hypothetical protein
MPASMPYGCSFGPSVNSTPFAARRTGSLEQDLALRVAGHVDGQPAHEAEVDVAVHLEAELADVEVERLVLVEDEDLGHVDVGEHGCLALL